MSYTTEITTIIGAVFLGISQLINAWVSLQNGAKLTTMSIQDSTTATMSSDKLDIIHRLTNSNLTALKVALIEANTKIERLEKLVLDNSSAACLNFQPKTPPS